MTRALDRQIAQQLGYHAERIDINALTDTETWCLVAPNGEILQASPPASQSEEGIWEAATPHFTTDLRAAMSLVPAWSSHRSFMLRQIQSGWVASFTDLERDAANSAIEDTGSTPEEAICMAWLACGEC